MRHAHSQHSRVGESGFTLLELLLSIGLTAVILVLVLEVFSVTQASNRMIRALGEPMTTGARVLDMIEDDLRSVWTYNIKEGKVLLGVSRDISSAETDRIHMIVGGPTVYPVRQVDDSYRRASIAEVSYMVKSRSDDNKDLLELWRREDPLVDDNMEQGGGFQLLTNRLRFTEGFRIQYFETIGKEAEAFNEWDSAERGRLPARIRIEFAIERQSATYGALNGPEVDEIGGRVLRYKRDIVLDPEKVIALTPGVALTPVIPSMHPELETAQAGGGGAAAAAGGAGSFARGTAPGDRPVTATGRGSASDRPGGATTPGRPGQGRPGVPPGMPIPGSTPPGNLGDIIRGIRGGGGGGR
jgi:type II secretory pathway pseudopilin PulG